MQIELFTPAFLSLTSQTHFFHHVSFCKYLYASVRSFTSVILHVCDHSPLSASPAFAVPTVTADWPHVLSSNPGLAWLGLNCTMQPRLGPFSLSSYSQSCIQTWGHTHKHWPSNCSNTGTSAPVVETFKLKVMKPNHCRAAVFCISSMNSVQVLCVLMDRTRSHIVGFWGKSLLNIAR